MDRRAFFAASASAAALAGAFAATADAADRRPPVSRVKTRDGAELFVRDWRPAGPPRGTLLFMAGWTLPSDFWGVQMADLTQRGFRCVAYDRRGHGRSGDPGGGYDYDHLTDDLAAVIAGLGAGKVTLVAHSMAAGEAAGYLTQHGDRRVAGLVLIGATTPFLLRTEDNPHGLPAAAFEGLRARLLLDFPGWIAENAAPFFTPQTPAETIAWGKALMLQVSRQAMLDCSRISGLTDFRPDLKAIRVPTLVIHGDKDASAPLPLTGQPTAALIPGARLAVYEGAPHGLPITHAARLNDDLAAFAGA
ncbi:MAG: alpha/beta hydrolase [Caulobacter sp.]|nr:alpha/beta hydrolase [Caulobacter sp.]